MVRPVDVTYEAERLCRVALKRSTGTVDPDAVRRCVQAIKRYVTDHDMLMTDLEAELTGLGIRRDIVVGYLLRRAERLRLQAISMGVSEEEG